MNRNKRGQALVEFALVLAVLLLIAIGGIRLGMAVLDSLAMGNAANAGVYQASLGKSESEVRSYIDRELRQKLVNPAEVTVAIHCEPAACGYGALVTIAMTKTTRINAVLWQAEFPLTTEASAIVQKEQ